jgi:superfamily II DNA or RNA helicase
MGQLDLFAWSADQPAATAIATPAPRPEPAPLEASAAVMTWAFKEAELRKSLRDYQQGIREATHDHFAAGERRGMVVAATGAGKTICFAALTADVVQGECRVLILTDQQDLVDQAIEKLQDVAGIYAAAEQAERSASRSARVVVATVQTMAARLEKYAPNHFTLVVCDECDRAVAPMWQKVLSYFADHAHILGVTATPKRADRKNILKFFKAKIYEVGLLELINRGFLVPVFVQQVPITIDLRKAEEEGTAGDYDQAEVGHAVEAIFDQVVEALHTHAAGLKTLVFNADVATSKKFVVAAQRGGLNARHIDATSPNRRELKQGFRDWKPGTKNLAAFQVLSNPVLLGRGYDDPSIECIVNLRPTKSVSLSQQIVGRGTRLFCPWGCGGPCEHPERKRRLLVLDFLYQFKEMGPIKPTALLTDSEDKAREMQAVIDGAQQALDLRDVMAEAESRMEKALVEAIAAAMKKTHGKKGEYYNALQFAATLHLPEIVDYVPETDADAAPVPPKIQKRLSKAGFIPETVPYLGLATRLLAAVEARREAGLASCKQVFWLRKWGYRDPWNMSREAATTILARKFAR